MKEQRNLTERERLAQLAPACVCNNLRRAARTVTNYYDELLESTGLRVSQLTILVILYLFGPQTINQIADKLALNRTTLARNLKPLAHKGLLTIASGSDQRSRVITLTAQGEAALLDVLPLWEQAQAHMVEGLGKAQAAKLLTQLSEVAELAAKG
jgi:DNA-binding MarR family transcriptional regulator